MDSSIFNSSTKIKVSVQLHASAALLPKEITSESSKSFGKETKFLACTGNRTTLHPVLSLVTTVAELSSLLLKKAVK